MVCVNDLETISEPLRVMLVDDDDMVSRFLEVLLSHYGCEVSVFNDSRQALEIFRNKPRQFDVIISDVRMPGLSGDCLAKAILNIRPDVPLVLVSGYAPDLDMLHLKKLGVKYFLSKPLDNKLLLQCIDEFKACLKSEKHN